MLNAHLLISQNAFLQIKQEARLLVFLRRLISFFHCLVVFCLPVNDKGRQPELHSYHLQLRDSISDRKSWNEALKFKIENHRQLSDKALAQIEENFKIRGEQIQELKHQLSSQETEFEDIARDFERTTAQLAVTNQAIIDAAAVEKDLTNNIEVLQKELTEKAAEVIRLSSTVTQQNSISDELAAAYRQMRNSTSRMRSLEKAINVANDEIKRTTAADENRIRSLELDLADKINSLTSIRRLVL